MNAGIVNSKRELVVMRREAALGDALCATSVAKKLAEMGYMTIFQTHPLVQPLIKRVPYVGLTQSVVGRVDVDLDNAYESHPQRTKRSFADIFFEKARAQLLKRGITLPKPTNVAPDIMVGTQELLAATAIYSKYPRPWIGISPRSNSHLNRTIPNDVWSQAAPKINGTCFWLGNHSPSPEHLVDTHCKDTEGLVARIAALDIFVGVDSGPMHMAAALEIPVVAFMQASSPDLHISDQRDFISEFVPGLDCLNCQDTHCRLVARGKNPPCQKIDPPWLAQCVNRRLGIRGDTVSVVIPTYRAPTHRLQRCVNSIAPQVDEVIITMDAGATVPNIRLPLNTRYVVKGEANIGFGRNVNFGFRHTNSRYVLILNDDCFLQQNAIKPLLDCMDARTGMVGHLLRYPDGKICHGGKHRKPGMRGWGLTDNRARNPSIRQPQQMEVVTGTSILVRRAAFYEAGAFDEDFFCYAEDDAFCLQMNQAGWKIMYTPMVSGIHEEAQTTRKVWNLGALVNDANKTFARKWGWYIDATLNNPPTT